jgi:hypothetical protein
MIAQADNEKTIVIIDSDGYSRNLHIVLTENNFLSLPKDLTDKHKNSYIKQCNKAI